MNNSIDPNYLLRKSTKNVQGNHRALKFFTLVGFGKKKGSSDENYNGTYNKIAARKLAEEIYDRCAVCKICA